MGHKGSKSQGIKNNKNMMHKFTKKYLYLLAKLNQKQIIKSFERT